MIANQQLYDQVKRYADTIYDKPSAYKSGFIVKKYKELGGTYIGDKPKNGLTRWYKEEWTDVNPYKTSTSYPVYRPTIRVNKNTPLTLNEISPANLKKQSVLKQKINGNLPPFKPKK